MEQEQESTGISRGQNQLHLLPEDPHTASTIVAPLVDRADPAVAATQIVVVTSDGDGAASLAGRLGTAGLASGLRIMAATDARRATRVQRRAPAHVVVAPPDVLVALMQSAVLKLDGVKAVVMAWVDELDERAMAALESVMSEIPKEAARVVLASGATPAVDALVERYARRARRTQSASVTEFPAASLSYVVTSDIGRGSALRRTLDALDPESAFVVARAPASRTAVEALLFSLGYGVGEDESVRVGDAPDGKPDVVILYDVLANESEVRTIAAAGSRVVALVTARQVAALRQLAGGRVTPLVLPDAAARARTREERLRDEMRSVLATGQFSRELLTLEPLLADHDGAEIAAAALRLLETERGKVEGAAPAQAPMTRLFINAGSMDEVRPGDLVGAITNEAGISKSELGRVDVRERHSTVEVATAVANVVVSKLTGTQIRGRRVLVRVDEDRPRERPGREGSAPRGDHRGPPRDRGPRDRGPRDRGPRDRGPRPARPRRGDDA